MFSVIPAKSEQIDAIAKKHNLRVIYDAAHAVGVNYKGRSIFEYGDISTTSFHATKMLNTAEGGACFALDVNCMKVEAFAFLWF